MSRVIFTTVMIFLIIGCQSEKGMITNITTGNEEASSVRFFFIKPAELDTLVVSAQALVTAPDMDSIFADLTVSSTQVEGVIENIPAGPHRKFEIFTYDVDTNLTYYGHEFADVISGQTITLHIILYPVNNSGTVIIVGTFSPFPPPSGYIVFEANYNGSIDIYRIRSDGTNLFNITNLSGTDEIRPCISPDGQKVLFSKRFPDGRIRPYQMEIDGNNKIELNIHTSANVVPWGWSPDMQKILVHSDADGDREIYIYNRNTHLTTQLTYNNIEDWGPKWSPGGDWILFYSNEGGTFHIYLIHPDGTNRHLLLPQTSYMEQRNGKFSPDGSKIVFAGRDTYSSWDSFIVNSDGSNLIRLNPDPNTNDFHACWSPDGQKILFVKYDNYHNGLYTMNLDGTDVQMLWDTPSSMEDYPDWK